MLSKSRIKFIRSLRLIKFRKTEGLFIIEGEKLVNEALNPSANKDFKLHSIYGLQAWLDLNEEILKPFKGIIETINAKELSQISNLKTPNQVLALVHSIQEETIPNWMPDSLAIGLDNIQDPGNLGTIIRLADWFGISNIVLSPGCADPFNPKVVQSSMGSIFRTTIIQTDLISLIKGLPADIPVYGAVLDGENIYKKKLSGKKGIIIFGNESQGISEEVSKFIKIPLTIPRGKDTKDGPESLNVSVATGIILSEFNRQSS